MTNRLKIGITCYPTFGGSGVVATEIGMAMAERGHKVHFISYEVPGRLDRFRENIYFHEVEVSTHPVFKYPPYSLALSSKMVEVATFEKLDLLHVHYAVPHATSAYLAKQILNGTNLKIITTLHGTDITLVGAERNYLPITRFSILKSDGVTTPSQFLKHATYDKLNVNTDFPIEVIPNFVDLDLFKPVAQKDRSKILKSICPRQDKKILIHVSNFRSVKRVDDVIEVFRIVRQTVPCHLLLVGDGPERSRLEKQVREMGIESDTCFLGKQLSVVDLIQNSDVLLLPSRNESFGLAALEALACGVPVVASRAEGIPEVVDHGTNGFLSDVGNTEDMARNCLSLLQDQAKYETFSKAARTKAETYFARDAIVDQYEQFYKQVLNQDA